MNEPIAPGGRAAAIVLSFGGGVQTITILALVELGRLPKPDLAVMADTGRERASTWRYLEQYARPVMDRLGIRFVIASHELATVDLYAQNGDLLIPAYTDTGKLPTFCSDKWKRQVVHRQLRALGYGPDNPVVMWLGMSLDETHRLRDSDIGWIQHHYPLCFDVPMRRVECETLLRRRGIPVPPKSTCWMCPHLNNEEWRDIRDNDPADFARAMALEAEISAADARGSLYLHGDRVPLAQADIDREREPLPLLECADSCWT